MRPMLLRSSHYMTGWIYGMLNAVNGPAGYMPFTVMEPGPQYAVRAEMEIKKARTDIPAGLSYPWLHQWPIEFEWDNGILKQSLR